MRAARFDRLVPLGGVVFVVLAVAGNALQGSTPAPHADAREAAEFYSDKPVMISLGMALSLFFLAWFLAALGRFYGGPKPMILGSAAPPRAAA